jgi:hypothetical protein
VPTATVAAALAGISIAPNPARQTIRIERAAGPAGELALTLLDMQGRTALTATMPSGSAVQALDVAPLTAGLYLLKIESADGTFSQKIEIR